jgi:hypothetical protein
MSELQAQIDANWIKIESEISASAERLFWRNKLARGDRLSVRQLMGIAERAIADFHNAGLSAGINERPPSDVGRFVAEAEKWLELRRGKLWALMQAEEFGQ